MFCLSAPQFGVPTFSQEDPNKVMKYLFSPTALALLALPLSLTTTSSAQLSGASAVSFDGDASFGWESRYFFRGRWFGDESAWMEVAMNHQLADKWSSSVHLFYTDVADRATAFSEGQIGATLAYDAGFGFFDLGVSHYHFFDGFGGNGTTLPILGNRDATEVNLTFSRELFSDISFYVMATYDFRIDGTYGELGVSKRWELTDRLGLGLSASTGYSIDDYYAGGLGNGDDNDGLTHSMLSLTFPFQIRDETFLTPHVTANFSQGAREASNALAGRDGTEIFYGVTLSFSF